jgi:predicted RNA methylase
MMKAEFNVVLDETGEALATVEGPVLEALREAINYYENYSEEGDEVTIEMVDRYVITKDQVNVLKDALEKGYDISFQGSNGNS